MDTLEHLRSWIGRGEQRTDTIAAAPLVALEATVARCDFKAVSPLFDLHRFEVCGRPDGERGFALCARNHEGGLAMQASAEVA